MRCSGLEHSLSNRSKVIDKCEPRLSRARAWISSTITVSTLRSISRLLAPVSSKYSDSGVVTKICGGRRSMAARWELGVSPVRTAARIGSGCCPAAKAACCNSASGTSKLRWISFDRAFSGEM